LEYLPNIIRATELNRMRWARQAAWTKAMRTAYTILVEESGGNKA
jgi:hypothetical protein